MKKKVLFLGASGNIGPFLTPGLEGDYELHLADIQPHPDGTPITTVDITSYEQVYEAARGMDAIVNFTVVRSDPVLSPDLPMLADIPDWADWLQEPADVGAVDLLRRCTVQGLPCGGATCASTISTSGDASAVAAADPPPGCC